MTYQTCLFDLFEQRVEQTPDRVALVFQDELLTYKELNNRSNRLAYKLQEMGVGPDVPVGLMLERSVEMIVGLLAILKAGGAYVPLDPEYPRDRIAYMIEDSGIALVLTQAHLVENLPENGVDPVLLSKSEGDYLSYSNSNPSRTAQSDNLAYIIYTSGSTGKPKGVMLEHRNVASFLNGTKQSISFKEDSSILCITTISFDIFVLETLLPLTEGYRVVLASREEQMDMLALQVLIQKHQVNTLQMTPSRMQLFLAEDPDLQSLSHVRTIMLGGEALPLRLLKKLQTVSGVKLFNMYGPTETTVWSLVSDVTNAEKVTIGTPINGTFVYVMDEQGVPVPQGEEGELYIGGPGVARGYFQRPELTAERFIVRTGTEGEERLYRTGDLVKVNEDGRIEYLGRNDFQVKVRGFRIELGEIEATLESHPNIVQAVVVVREEQIGNARISAYYVPAQLNPPSVRELKAYVQSRLPDYMTPSSWVEMEQWPLTPNGKIDRRALPNPSMSRLSLELPYVEPKTEIEIEIAAIWADILEYDRVGIEDNFIELGGNSILTTQVLTRIDQTYKVRVSFQDMLIRGNTVKVLASIVEELLLLQAGDEELALLLAELEGLSDEEAEALK
ncbi:non-ribosomal peptide synthetase [Paenibacillus sp. MMS18-CY102]|uniref:non-ribosomal peptide synthetase n=1 Tax=Paenibacillus sp. MMS18-CY102 TaxID=2682849 RepID=UPI001365FFBD|nr:non-ribosomal peptide synthetase [Paenibacillus sp. MMS18-CY102]MWC27750.1 amino acid adenylation domain-containing protein [Paenibacillus sp. MMS18-CY102]